MTPETVQVALAQVLERLILRSPSEELRAVTEILPRFCRAARCDLCAVLGRMNDPPLVVAIRKELYRDLAFAEVLVNRREKALLRYFRRLAGQEQDAQDLLQDLYRKLWAPGGLDSYNPEKRFDPWVRRLAHNLGVDQLRRGARRRERTEPLGTEHEAPLSGPLAGLIEREEMDGLEDRLALLPTRQQFVIRKMLHGADIQEIARWTGLELPRVYQLRFKGVAALRQQSKQSSIATKQRRASILSGNLRQAPQLAAAGAREEVAQHVTLDGPDVGIGIGPLNLVLLWHRHGEDASGGPGSGPWYVSLRLRASANAAKLGNAEGPLGPLEGRNAHLTFLDRSESRMWCLGARLHRTEAGDLETWPERGPAEGPQSFARVELTIGRKTQGPDAS